MKYFVFPTLAYSHISSHTNTYTLLQVLVHVYELVMYRRLPMVAVIVKERKKKALCVLWNHVVYVHVVNGFLMNYVVYVKAVYNNGSEHVLQLLLKYYKQQIFLITALGAETTTSKPLMYVLSRKTKCIVELFPYVDILKINLFRFETMYRVEEQNAKQNNIILFICTYTKDKTFFVLKICSARQCH